MSQTDKDSKPAKITWLKRVGLAGFLFFLFKGIGWLIFFYFGASIFKGCGF